MPGVFLDPNETLDITTQIGYRNSNVSPDRIIIYPGDEEQDIAVLESDISLSGRIRSDVIGPVLYSNVGSLSKEDVSEAIYKDVADIIRQQSVPSGGGTIDQDAFVSTHDHALLNGDILYYKGGDVTINASAISGKKTLIVEGGDVLVEGDITYASPNASLGVIVLRAKNTPDTPQNVYIDKTVINMHGIWYVEGSIFSWKGDGAKTRYDGTNTFEIAGNIDLKHQFYMKGTIISQNTLGGSRKTPPELPVGVFDAAFDASPTQEIAQGYDLKYLRQYRVDNPATPTIDEGTGGTPSFLTNENASVVIDHDPGLLRTERIPHGFESILTISAEEVSR